ncbi:MAG: hypothetical protein ACD_39C02121G0006 [uncultured bacterium]|nr:MAG: hypothetical protein ACD_39C02121G0006 [uncultured bacterium]
MFEIFSQKDVEKFKELKSYPEVFAAYLEARFNELKICLEEHFEGEDEFSLKDFGHMVVLSPLVDKLNDLNEVGLCPEENGLWGAIPEVVEEIVMPGCVVYQISIIYNDSYMMIFYLQKSEVEDCPEFQAFLKRHAPSTIYFEPQGNRKPRQSKAKYLFSGTKYITQGVDIHIPLSVQLAMWQFIEKRSTSQNPPMDYLQCFTLTPSSKNGKSVQKIECSQEQPAFNAILKVDAGFTVSEKIFVIDDVSHVTMLLSREY